MKQRAAFIVASLAVAGFAAWWLFLRPRAASAAPLLQTESESEAGAGMVEKLRAAVEGRMSGPRWDRLTPEAKAKATELVDAARARGLDVMFWDGWRDPEESAKNIAAGTSKLKDPLDSLHVWGVAFDLVFRGALGQPTWPEANDPRWRELAELGASLGLNSGLLMWGWDGPHFQLPDTSAVALRSRWGGDYLAFLSNAGATVA
jgi:hypothetical protein